MTKTFSVVALNLQRNIPHQIKNALLSFISVYTGCIMGSCRRGLEVNIQIFERRQQFKNSNLII